MIIDDAKIQLKQKVGTFIVCIFNSFLSFSPYELNELKNLPILLPF